MTNSTYIVRRTQTKDLTALSEIFHETFSSEPWNEPWTPEKAQGRINQLLSVPHHISFLIERDEEIVGFIIGHIMNWHDNGYLEIVELCIKATAKRSGLGTGLLRHIEASARDQGITSIILITKHGDEAWEFYRKNGYEQMDGMILMKKELGD